MAYRIKDLGLEKLLQGMVLNHIIMLPYAGNLGNAYIEWRKYTKPLIEFVRIDYNGTGKRYMRNKALNWEQLVDNTFNQIKDIILDGYEYILFGHSMGAKVAYDIYYKILHNNYKLYKFLVLSGTGLLNKKKNDLLSMGKEEFEKYFIQLGGIQKEILENQELKELVFSRIHNDIKLLDGFNFKEYQVGIQCPVIIINVDKEKYSSLTDWNMLLWQNCIYQIFNGNHFFLQSDLENVYRILSDIWEIY